jgi:large subunit ribosomal protein L25
MLLKATKRKTGTRAAKKLRLHGQIPASIQGGGKPNADVAIDERGFMAMRRKHEHVFEVSVEGADEETALIKEVRWDTTSERILHVEFRRIVKGQKTEVEVELVFEGHPKGGVTNHLVTHVTIRSLPQDIPDGIMVQMGGLEVGQVLHARDLVLPHGVELLADPNLPIANVAIPRAIEEPTAAPAEAAAPSPIPGAAPTPPPAE